MADLLTITDDLTDELGCNGTYVTVKQSRTNPRVIVEVDEYVYDSTDNAEDVITDIVADHTDLDVEIEVM